MPDFESDNQQLLGQTLNRTININYDRPLIKQSTVIRPDFELENQQ